MRRAALRLPSLRSQHAFAAAPRLLPCLCPRLPQGRFFCSTNSGSVSGSGGGGGGDGSVGGGGGESGIESRLAWLQSLSPIDAEKELFKLKRKMGSYYSLGKYAGALECAIELEGCVKGLMGRDNAMYASCLNNVALMNKMLGQNEEAKLKYTEALHVYEDAVGKKHKSYASTLANLGVLYRTLAETSKGMEKLSLLDQGESALKDALVIRKEVCGEKSREVLTTSNNLASIWRLRDRPKEAQAELEATLEVARAEYGNNDNITALTLNALGLLLKAQGQLDEAKMMYDEALEIRSKTLGDSHPDTVVSMHNLAELLIEMKREPEAIALQEKLLSILGVGNEEGREEELVAGQDKKELDASATSPPSSPPFSPSPSPLATTKTEREKEEPSVSSEPPITFATRKKKKKTPDNSSSSAEWSP